MICMEDLNDLNGQYTRQSQEWQAFKPIFCYGFSRSFALLAFIGVIIFDDIQTNCLN